MAQQINEITKMPSNSEVIKILNQIIKRYNSLGDLYQYKGSVQTYDDLLAIQNPQIGDVYNVIQEDAEEGIAAGSNFAWDGTVWDNLGMSLDGLVRKINGFTPDDLGAVIFQYIKNIEDDDGTLTVTVRDGEEETQLTIQTGKVKTVNGVEPDKEGNIQITTNEGVWQANEEVEVGDMRYLAGRDNTGYMLEYVGAGTTGQTQPVVPDMTEVANYSAIDRVGKMRMIFNLAEKDVDEILAAGVLYNRATYEELWNYVQLKPSLLISEAEWQAKYAQTNGKFVPYYSEGDGTTTFRTPLLSAYPCGVSSSDDIGNYASDGLPNVTGNLKQDTTGGATFKREQEGIFSDDESSYSSYATRSANGYSTMYNVNFNLSKGNPIYGAADEVRPKTMYGIWVIKAVGVIVDSIGNTDLTNVLNAVETVQSEILNLENKVNDLHNQDKNFTIIYPNGGTKESPADVTLNKVYIENNPFPGYYVDCKVQIYSSEKNMWLEQPFWWSDGSYGVYAYLERNTDKIYVATGSIALVYSDAIGGSGVNLSSNITTAPCRVLVHKLAKIEEE